MWPGRVPIEVTNQPTNAVLLTGNLGDVTNIHYFAPTDVAVDRFPLALTDAVLA